MEYWKDFQFILSSTARGWLLASKSGVIIRNRHRAVTTEEGIQQIPSDGWEYSIATGEPDSSTINVKTADIKINVVGTGPQWFPDPQMEVVVFHPTHPGTVLGWIIFALLIALVLGYLYLRFYKKKSVKEFGEEFRAFLVSTYEQVRAFRGVTES